MWEKHPFLLTPVQLLGSKGSGECMCDSKFLFAGSAILPCPAPLVGTGTCARSEGFGRQEAGPGTGRSCPRRHSLSPAQSFSVIPQVEERSQRVQIWRWGKEQVWGLPIGGRNQKKELWETLGWEKWCTAVGETETTEHSIVVGMRGSSYWGTSSKRQGGGQMLAGAFLGRSQGLGLEQMR